MDASQIIYIPTNLQIFPNQQRTVNVFAAVVEPKLVNALLRRLNQIAPLESLRHVKRVQKKCIDGTIQLAVILCEVNENDSHPDNIPHNVREFVNCHQLSAFITKVSKEAASSKEQWEEQCKLWPTSYHPPTYKIDGVGGFSDEDRQSIISFMKFAVEMAKRGDGLVVNAAVIVDPSVKKVIASACDENYMQNSLEMKSCLKNCSFHFSNSSGKRNNEKLPSNDSLEEPNQNRTGVSCLNPWQWAEEQSDMDNFHSWHPLRHAAIAAIESSAARDRKLFPGNEDFGEIQLNSVESNQTEISSVSSATRQKISLKTAENDEKISCPVENVCSRPYLCTGYDIYLVWEPCPMCAMALVHQRMRRIFYTFANPNVGALGSVYRLQGEKSLNHHYAVFRVLLRQTM